MQRFAEDSPLGAQAFDALYLRYKDKTWRYFRRQLDHDASHDAQQDLWTKIIERRKKYKSSERFGGYLFSVANSVLVDAQRKTMRVVDAAIDPDASLDQLTANSSTEPARASHLSRAIGALKTAIGNLPLSQRNTFVLYQESGLSYADIAQATGTSTETVKSRLRYARKKLAEDLEEELRHVEL